MDWKSSLRCITGTFAIGLIAGVAPFVFMYLLPAMLSPEVEIVSPNYWAITLVGVLIGAITSIVFTSKFDSTEPREIFVYSLGVPAILIATATNITAVFKADRRIAEVQHDVSSAIVSPAPKPEATDREPKQLLPPEADSATAARVAVRWVGQRLIGHRVYGGQPDTSYFVVIGEYTNPAQAWDDYAKFQNVKLQTERYLQKSLGVYEVQSGVYFLVFSRYTSEADAIRAYQLLKINDPQLSVRILKHATAQQ